jgi:predicted PurR-regulated permease PerM
MRISFKDLFYNLAFFIAATAILYFGKDILIPIAFALLIAFILYPAVKWLTSRNVKKLLAIIIVMIGVLLLSSGVLFLFSTQVIDIAGNYTDFLNKLRSTWNALLSFFNEHVQVIPDLESQDLLDRLSNFFSDSSIVIISDTIGFTSSFFSYLTLSLIYTFLILFYHDHFLRAISEMSTKENRGKFVEMLKQIQQVGQQYFTGMLLLILLLGLLNSLGLLVIGIDYPFFFGFLAALLAIIPYIGTTLGGLIPTVYAFVTYDSYWYPIGVIGVFWAIQFIEGNFLNPKIVGGTMQINALVSILALIVGGILWGLPGMILFLPLTAMVKVICGHYENLKPIALLLSDSRKEKVRSNLFSRMNRFLKSKINQ